MLSVQTETNIQGFVSVFSSRICLGFSNYPFPEFSLSLLPRIGPRLLPRPGPYHNRCHEYNRVDYLVTHYGKVPASGVNLESRLKVDLDKERFPLRISCLGFLRSEPSIEYS